ncbi:MAG TPA: glycosyltransferase family 4 protein [Solirubrobacteraceae bacterium]|nr:glycosyltransferase family 4 protein [Solirubrobacteraceae bacterium]
MEERDLEATGADAKPAAADPAEPAAVGIGSVLLLTPRWARDGGVATHAIASAGLLASAGIEVTVLCARADDAERVPGVRVLTSPELFRADAAPEARLAAAAGIRPDVVHCHQFDEPGLLAQLRRTAPVVQSAHGYTACTAGVHYFRPGEQCNRAHGPGCWPNLLLRGCAHTNNPRRLPANYRAAAQGQASLREADLAISYSSAVDKHLAENGVERRSIVPLFTTLRPARGSGHERRRRVVFSGRVVAPKGVDVLLRAMRGLDAELVVCGDGWRLQEMRELGDRLGLGTRARFTGWLAPPDLARELAEASIVAIPSVWPEPFGLAGIEAFEAGRPVVASLTGGVGDWLQDGVNGLAVPPGDEAALASALGALLDDPARQAAMGAAGGELARSLYTPAAHLDALRSAYARARERWLGLRRSG